MKRIIITEEQFKKILSEVASGALPDRQPDLFHSQEDIDKEQKAEYNKRFPTDNAIKNAIKSIITNNNHEMCIYSNLDIIEKHFFNGRNKYGWYCVKNPKKGGLTPKEYLAQLKLIFPYPTLLEYWNGYTPKRPYANESWITISLPHNKPFKKDDVNENVLLEDKESKNLHMTREFLRQHGYEGSRLDYIMLGLRTDIPNSRVADYKFLPGLARIALSPSSLRANTIFGLNKILPFIANNHFEEYDSNLNGKSAEELIKIFMPEYEKNIENDKKELKNIDFSNNSNNEHRYQVVRISNFEAARQYSKYCSDWCITTSSQSFDQYTSNGSGTFYFLLDNGYQNVPREAGPNYPKDKYGMSMIAVSVNEDGSLNTSTSRWNHGKDHFDISNCDHLFTTNEISNLLGYNFYDILKPKHNNETNEYSEVETRLKDGERPERIFDEMEKDEGQNMRLVKFQDKYNFLKRDGTLAFPDQWLDDVEERENGVFYKIGNRWFNPETLTFSENKTLFGQIVESLLLEGQNKNNALSYISKLKPNEDNNAILSNIISNCNAANLSNNKWLPAICKLNLVDNIDLEKLDKLFFYVDKYQNTSAIAGLNIPINYKNIDYNTIESTIKEYVNRANSKEKQKQQIDNATTVNNYKIIPLLTFEDAKKYSEIAGWCVTHEPGYYGKSKYNPKGDYKWYLLLNENTYKKYPGDTSKIDISTIPNPEKCPYDEYGLSAIICNIMPDGNLNICSTRWNVDRLNKDENGDYYVDRTNEDTANYQINENQLNELLGQDYHNLLKPFTEEELIKIKEEEERLFKLIQEKLDNGEDPRNIFDYVGNYYYYFAVVRLNNKWNFINTEGQILSQQWFDGVDDFHDGFARVRLNNKYNFINTEGQIISQQWFDDTYDFHEGFAEVILNHKCNFINKEGQIIYEPNNPEKWFDYANNFSDGLAWVRINNKRNFINKEGQIIYEPNNPEKWFDYAENFYNGFASVKLNNKDYRLNTQGQLCDYNTKQPIPELNNEAKSAVKPILEMMKRMNLPI